MTENEYDKVELARLKEEYFSALNADQWTPFWEKRLYLAEEALIDFADKMFEDDLKNRLLLQRCRIYSRDKLVRLILRLSIA